MGDLVGGLVVVVGLFVGPVVVVGKSLLSCTILTPNALNPPGLTNVAVLVLVVPPLLAVIPKNRVALSGGAHVQNIVENMPCKPAGFV